MKRGLRRSAFTLIELLVVVAIIALLLSILLPSLAGAREQGKRAKCLANLSSIGKACYQYSGEDRTEQIVPVHENMVKGAEWWLWRLANWMGWGGRSGQEVFYTNFGHYMLAHPDEFETPPAGGYQWREEYSARRRPLNRYVLTDVQTADTRKLEWYACPSDTGYPDSDQIDDSPRPNADRSCYNTLGNSYRASLNMITLVGGTASSGHFSRGPWGHRITSLREVSKLILLGEPTFFNMIGMDSGPSQEDPVLVMGWHKRKMQDNLLYCDGSARTSIASALFEFDPADIARMMIADNDQRLLGRGASWRLDVYPTPGARIFGSNRIWESVIGAQYRTHWPYANHEENFLD